MTCNTNTATMNSLFCCSASPAAAPTVVITTIDLLSDDAAKGTQYALKGSLPTTLGLLTALQILKLSHQSFGGTIPSQLGYISSLNYLGLQNNVFSGTIPTSFGLLTNLQTLHLDNNVNAYRAVTIPPTGSGLRGSIPSTLSRLSSLTFINMGNNLLTGTIPSYFSSFLSLAELDLDVNFLTGSVPSTLCNLNNVLRILRFSVNKLCCYALCFKSSPGSEVFGTSDSLSTGAKQRCSGAFNSSMCAISDCSNGGCSPTLSPTVKPTVGK